MTVPAPALEAYLKWKAGFIRKLALFHFALILLFDLLAVFTPEVMTRPLSPTTPFTVGVVLALLIVFSVISATILYAWRVNQEESGLETAKGEE